MRTTVALDDDLLADAQRLTGLTERTAVIREALVASVERESARRLALLGGREPDARYIPRRRSEVRQVVLIDTSIWVDHFKATDPTVQGLLPDRRVLIHPGVIGEPAMGTDLHRSAILDDLRELPRTTIADDAEILRFVEIRALFGIGIGHIDAPLPASTTSRPGSTLRTRDERLSSAAERLGIAAELSQ